MSASLQSSKMQRALRELKQLNEEIDSYLADMRAQEQRAAELQRELTLYLTGTIFDPPMPYGISDEARRILERNWREEDSPLRDYFDSPLKRQGNQPLPLEDMPRLPLAITDPASRLLEQSDGEQDNARRADDLARNNDASVGRVVGHSDGDANRRHDVGNDPVNNGDPTGLEKAQATLGGGTSGGHGASGSFDNPGASGTWDYPPGYVPMGGTPSAKTLENLFELREDMRPGGYWGGWVNPANWLRGLYTGDANAPDAEYNGAMTQGAAIGLPNPGVDASVMGAYIPREAIGPGVGATGGGGIQVVHFWGDGTYLFRYGEGGATVGTSGRSGTGNLQYLQVSNTRLAENYSGNFSQLSASFVGPSGKGVGGALSSGDPNASEYGTTVTAAAFGFSGGTPGGTTAATVGTSRIWSKLW